MEKYNILLIACWKWGYSAADLSGTTRSKYSTDVKIIKVKCTGRIDMKFILAAFNHGADAVMVVGWHIGECEFEDGNIQAKKRVLFLKRVLDDLGINGDRLNIYECGAAEVNKFLESINDTLKKLKPLGRSPLAKIT